MDNYKLVITHVIETDIPWERLAALAIALTLCVCATVVVCALVRRR